MQRRAGFGCNALAPTATSTNFQRLTPYWERLKYKALVVGASIPVGDTTMHIVDSNNIRSSDGGALSVVNNGTKNATFNIENRYGTQSLLVGSPPAHASTGAGSRKPDYSAACWWAIADMGLADAGALLGLATIETGIGLAGFLISLGAATSCAYHIQEVCK